jgi:hypothetical protein
MYRSRLLAALLTMAAAAGSLSACGSSSHKAASSSTTSSTTQPTSAVATFCQKYLAIGSDLQGLGTEGSVAQLRSDLSKAVSDAETLASSYVPKGSGVEAPVAAIANDVKHLLSWAQSANASDFNSLAKAKSLNQLPAPVRGPIQDLESQATKVSGYVQKSCKA